MNKVVAVFHLRGAQCAMTALENIGEKKKMESFYLFHSLRGEIHSRLGNISEANKCFERAMTLTRSEAEKSMLRERLK